MLEYGKTKESYLRIISGCRGDVARHVIFGLDILRFAYQGWEPQLRPTIRVLRSLSRKHRSVWHVTSYPWGNKTLPEFQYSLYYEGEQAGQRAGRQSRIFVSDRFVMATASPVNDVNVPIPFSDKVLEQALACDGLAVYFAPVSADRSMVQELLLCEDDVLEQLHPITDEAWIDRVLEAFSGVFFTSADARVGILCCKPPVADALDDAIRAATDALVSDPKLAEFRNRLRWLEEERAFVLVS